MIEGIVCTDAFVDCYQDRGLDALCTHVVAEEEQQIMRGKDMVRYHITVLSTATTKRTTTLEKYTLGHVRTRVGYL